MIHKRLKQTVNWYNLVNNSLESTTIQFIKWVGARAWASILCSKIFVFSVQLLFARQHHWVLWFGVILQHILFFISLIQMLLMSCQYNSRGELGLSFSAQTPCIIDLQLTSMLKPIYVIPTETIPTWYLLFSEMKIIDNQRDLSVCRGNFSVTYLYQ